MRRMLSDAKEEEWVSAPAPRHRAAPEENRLKNSCSCIAIFLLPLRSISIILLQYFFGCFAVLLWILCSISLGSFQYFARGKATQASCACAGVLTAARIHSHDWAVAAPTATAAATPAPPGRTEQLGFKPQSLLNSCFSMIDPLVYLELERQKKANDKKLRVFGRAAPPRCVLRGPGGGQQPSPGRGCLGAAAQLCLSSSSAVTPSAANGEELQSLGRTFTAGETFDGRPR